MEENATLKVSLIQAALHWENAAANREMLAGRIKDIGQATDLIVLPEMFSTGFSMRTELAEDMKGLTVQWMKDIARQSNAAVCGSLMMRTGQEYVNRLIWMQPDGACYTYDKRHLFGLGDEHNHYKAGREKIIVEWRGWKILPLICYDLRFPVWSRQQKDNRYDLLLYVANWPERRSHAWKTLLPARAIENQSYAIGLNRVGNDGHNIYHSGDSMVVDPLGEIAWQQQDKEAVFTTTLFKDHLQKIRSGFPFLEGADDFRLL